MHIPGEMRNFGQAKGWMNDERLAKLNEFGRLGNINGRPNEQDLLDVERQVRGILMYLINFTFCKITSALNTFFRYRSNLLFPCCAKPLVKLTSFLDHENAKKLYAIAVFYRFWE